MTAAAPLDPEQLDVYFALTEVSSLLQRAIEQQLRAAGGLSYVQFLILVRLAHTPGGRLRMTDLADGVVHSRSGLTYQAGLLDEAGLTTRRRSADDERSTVVTITDAGRARVEDVLPGHNAVARGLLFDPLTTSDLETLGDVLNRVRDHIRSMPRRPARRTKPDRGGRST